MSEYLRRVFANRVGHTTLSVGQLTIIQKTTTLSVFVPFAWVYLKEPPRLGFLWAGLYVCGALSFVFRGAHA